jgi:hypothetical protein
MWKPVGQNCLRRYVGVGVKFAKLSYNISLPDNRLEAAEREKKRTAYGTPLAPTGTTESESNKRTTKRNVANIVMCGGDYRRGLEWSMDLLTI